MKVILSDPNASDVEGLMRLDLMARAAGMVCKRAGYELIDGERIAVIQIVKPLTVIPLHRNTEQPQTAA